MSEKLTKQKIDEMIKELLQERKISIVYPNLGDIESGKQAERDSFYPQINKADLEAFANRDGDASDITFDDFADAASDKPQSNLFKNLKGATSPDKTKKAAEDAEELVDKGFKSSKQMATIDTSQAAANEFANSKSIAFKTMNTISADPSDPKIMGSFPQGIATATRVFFQDKNSLFDRIEKANSFLSKLYHGEVVKRTEKMLSIADDSKSKYLAGIIFCDYLATLVQETDSGAAAYNFEALLAMMSGGRVTGKATTTKGKMGATDFITNTGIKGSSKYFSKTGTAAIKQAVGGFNLDEPIFYIVALKKEATRGKKTLTKGLTSDPRLIKELWIYNLVIMKHHEDKDNCYFYIKNGSGQIIDVTIKAPIKKNGERTSAYLGFGTKEFLQEPIVLKVGTAGPVFQEYITNAIADTDVDVNAMTRYLVDALEGSQSASQQIQAYASTGDKKIGNQALESLIKAEDNLKDLGTESFGAKFKQGKFKESKIQSLDDLIAETLRDIKKKRKK